VLLAALCNPAWAEEWTAQSRMVAAWGIDADPVVKTGTVNGEGRFTLGANNAAVYATPNSRSDPKPKATYAYQPRTETLRSYVRWDGGSPLARNRTVEAFSKMVVGEMDPVTKMFPWTLTLTATSSGGFGSPGGDSTAKGGDPQYVDTPGMFGDTFALGPGSSLFESRPGIEHAWANFKLTAPSIDPNVPSIDLAVIDLSIVSDPSDPRYGMLDAEVELAYVPGRLEFYEYDSDPNSPLVPIDAAGIEALLEGSSSLATLTGLSTELRLFTYAYDLTGLTLHPEAAFGSEGECYATGTGIPEPGSLALLSLGVVLGSFRRRHA
jgi:hypothetical protein